MCHARIKEDLITSRNWIRYKVRVYKVQAPRWAGKFSWDYLEKKKVIRGMNTRFVNRSKNNLQVYMNFKASWIFLRIKKTDPSWTFGMVKMALIFVLSISWSKLIFWRFPFICICIYCFYVFLCIVVQFSFFRACINYKSLIFDTFFVRNIIRLYVHGSVII